ncbi:MAG: PAS domain-containing protein, partial [Planctomycetota bacterium]
VIKDPPFTKLDVISCRNLMIYLNADLQHRLLPIFHYALKPGGLLMLGPSETTGRFSDLFDTVDKKWKIFRRKETPTAVRELPEMPASQLPADAKPSDQSGTRLPGRTRAGVVLHIPALVERLALKRFCPPFVVVNERGDIVHVHGRTGEYLELAEGRARTNVLDMAREGLPHELSALMRQAVAADGEVVRDHVRVRTNGDFAWVNLSATRLLEPEPLRGLLLLVFRPVSPPAEPTPKQKSKRGKAAPDHVETLERELRIMKETHQTTLEELETLNEELKSTNEELQSTNEEMQSTNEELETSKEEMQSLNEELTTVNSELQSKVDDLSQANDDMQNLLNSTDIATIFLDDELNIKRFTEQAQKIIALRPTDVGRPIGELTSCLIYDDLPQDCTEVLDTLAFRTREVAAKDGGWYQMRILPYRTTDRVIDGLVLTFVNITDLKAAEKAGELRTYFESIFETVRQPLLVLDEQRAIDSANRCFYETFRLRPKQVHGVPLYELGDGAWDIPELRELLDEVLPRNTTFDNFEVASDFPGIGRRVFILNARRLDRNTALPGRILLAMEDITNRPTA